jgi:hypothetical protein
VLVTAGGPRYKPLLEMDGDEVRGSVASSGQPTSPRSPCTS